jgi:hypothetical protein
MDERGPTTRRVMLDVEDDEQRQSRIRTLNYHNTPHFQAHTLVIESYLEKLNTSTQTSRPFDATPKFHFGDRTTYPVKPNSERALSNVVSDSSQNSCLVSRNPVLTRVQAFLPQMEASNTLLSQRMQDDPTSVDIEHVSEEMGQYIEMVQFLFYISHYW